MDRGGRGRERQRQPPLRERHRGLGPADPRSSRDPYPREREPREPSLKRGYVEVAVKQERVSSPQTGRSTQGREGERVLVRDRLLAKAPSVRDTTPSTPSTPSRHSRPSRPSRDSQGDRGERERERVKTEPGAYPPLRERVRVDVKPVIPAPAIPTCPMHRVSHPPEEIRKQYSLAKDTAAFGISNDAPVPAGAWLGLCHKLCTQEAEREAEREKETAEVTPVGGDVDMTTPVATDTAAEPTPSAPTSTLPKRVLVTGSTSTGKSAFVRTLVNVMLSTHGQDVYILDADPGQSEWGPQCCVSVFKATLALPPFTSPYSSAPSMSTAPVVCLPFGHLTPREEPMVHASIVEECLTRVPPSALLVVNAHGWNTGFGSEALDTLIRAVSPQAVVEMRHPSAMSAFQQEGSRRLSPLMLPSGCVLLDCEAAKGSKRARAVRDISLLRRLDPSLCPMSNGPWAGLGRLPAYRCPLSSVSVVFAGQTQSSSRDMAGADTAASIAGKTVLLVGEAGVVGVGLVWSVSPLGHVHLVTSLSPSGMQGVTQLFMPASGGLALPAHIRQRHGERYIVNTKDTRPGALPVVSKPMQR
ncbi:hypothetical protein KIPB_000002 [Kipferlia bialata]|uniref:Clp1 P-loop domain-containing protein n=1 Tax=Kipferlia bialata TaxID=797122 RepID=A0A9K3GE59_9EUKA|nr:hypothetical protein KIPB_000002 [Kipferlia bialata]|eukprot:g2.t1